MARPIDLDQLMKYPLRPESAICDEEHADPHFLNGVESILEWAQTLPTLTQPNEWISVEEKLPEKGENVLVYAIAKYIGDTKIGIDKLEEGERRPVWFYTHGWFEVTHWMPLPEPPGEDNNVPANEPLTLEQLRQMDGEPVYIPEIECWVLVKREQNTFLFTFSDGRQCPASEWYEQVGPVYRRLPEGES